MKNILYVLLFSLFFLKAASAQTITETEVFKNTSGTDFDPYGLQYDNSGNWAFIKTDNSDPNVSRSMIISNKFSSDWMENLNDPGKYDKKGNLYTTTFKMKSDGSYETEYYTLLVNGVPAGNYDYLDPYNSFINANGDYEFIYSKGSSYYIGRMSGKDLSETGPYKMIKYAFKSIYSNNGSGEGEGHIMYDKVQTGKGEGFPADGAPQNDMFYRDSRGNIGYILINDNGANIKFGDNLIETSYPDINESSFQNDNNNDMVFIGKDRSDYAYSGFQTIVMKNNKYMVRGMINTPLVFTSDNVPVYSVMDSINETIYNTKVYKGDKEFQVYRDAARTKKVMGFNSGVSDLTIENGKIIFTGSTSIQGKKSEKYPEGEYTTKGSLVVDGVMGPELENISMIKRSPSGKLLYSYMPDHGKVQYGLFTGDMNNSERVLDKGFDYFTDYDFIPGTTNFYAVASKDGNYEKGTPGKTYVYMNNKMVSETELVSSGNNLDPNNFSVVRFAPNGDYAYGGGNSKGETWTYNVYTKNGIQKVDKSAVQGLGDFNSVDYVSWLPNNKLFYIGSVNTSAGTTYSQNNYLVYDGKVLDKSYDNIQDLSFNKSDNTLSFKGIRGNSVYNVKVNL